MKKLFQGVLAALFLLSVGTPTLALAADVAPIVLDGVKQRQMKTGDTLGIGLGGTGAASAAAARTALGLAIGTNVQAYDADLTTWAGITPSANVQTLLSSANYSGFRSSLGVAIGSDVQAYDADLAAIAALSGTDTIYYRSAANTWSGVTVGSGCTFTTGTLACAGTSTGTVTASGSPTSGYLATWTSGTNLTKGDLSGDISTAGSLVTAIGSNKVTNGMMRQSGALAVVGRSANSTGNVADIQATAATDAVLRESGSTIGFGTIATGGIANSAVTLAKIANASANSKLLGAGASGSGSAYTEITLGTNLSMSGTTLNATGGSGSGKPFIVFRPIDNEPPSTNFCSLDSRNGHPVLNCDTTTAESAIFTSVLPTGYAGGGLKVCVQTAAATATSGTIGWLAAIERIDYSSLDIDADSFASDQTITATTVPGTSGQVLNLCVTISSGANMDSLAASEPFRLRIKRDVANDNATGDAQIVSVTVEEP